MLDLCGSWDVLDFPDARELEYEQMVARNEKKLYKFQ
jgi:hypothetical protein